MASKSSLEEAMSVSSFTRSLTSTRSSTSERPNQFVDVGMPVSRESLYHIPVGIPSASKAYLDQKRAARQQKRSKDSFDDPELLVTENPEDAPTGDDENPIPTYRIDLSLPPSERYLQLATEMGEQMQTLTPLLDQVLQYVIPYGWVRRVLEFIFSLLLFRMYSQEETQELRGIAKASGVDMYFLVTFNVLLDTMMGCTSGGTCVTPKERKRSKLKGEENVLEGQEDRMMHFRTLDWNMDELRSVIVVLEFVRSKSEEPEKVIARTISYAGFVGTLTGVRENLSLSMNFRPNHSCSTLALRWHQLLVLLGFRPCIASILRSLIFPANSTPTPLTNLVTSLTHTPTPMCYLIFCDSSQTFVIEKDLYTGKIRSSSEFIVHTNNDEPDPSTEQNQSEKEKVVETVLGDQLFPEESDERKACMEKKWSAHKKRHLRKLREGKAAVREETLKKWVRIYPVMNEMSHFACLMDPRYGEIRWLERGRVEGSSDEEEEEVPAEDGDSMRVQGEPNYKAKRNELELQHSQPRLGSAQVAKIAIENQEQSDEKAGLRKDEKSVEV